MLTHCLGSHIAVRKMCNTYNQQREQPCNKTRSGGHSRGRADKSQ